MYSNKVEICGINTSELKVLKEKEKKELLRQIREGKNPRQARERLINGNLKLVLSVIQRFNNRGENMDDLFQVGCIGLMKAIDRFNIDQDVRFSTYAVPMIQGELRRYLRDFNSIRVSRSLKDTAYKAMKTKEALTIENLKEPTIDEIANKMGEKRENVVTALESIVDPVSLYEPVYSGGGDTIFVMDQIGDQSQDTNWIDELSIKDAISKLDPREKRILSLRFFNGKTQVEVAREIGISQAQVSRLEKGALGKIKGKLDNR